MATEDAVRFSVTTKNELGEEARIYEGRPVAINPGEDGTWLRLLDCSGAFSDRAVRLESCSRIEIVAVEPANKQEVE